MKFSFWLIFSIYYSFWLIFCIYYNFFLNICMFIDKTFSKTSSLSILYIFLYLSLVVIMESILNVKLSLKYLVSKWKIQWLFTLLKNTHCLMWAMDAMGFFLQRVKYERQFYHMNKFWQDIHKLLKNVDD